MGKSVFFLIRNNNTIWCFKLFKIKQIIRELEEKLRKIGVQIRVCNEVLYTKTCVKSSTREILLGKALNLVEKAVKQTKTKVG